MLQSDPAAATPAASSPAQELLGVIDGDAACAILRISRRTFDRLVRDDPSFARPFRIGSRLYIRLADLQAWIDMRARAAA
jgi:predicted DNA-binding transcriptional regulator AlpA